MAPLKVGILGASGETGSSIVNGLLESKDEFEIVALTRPSSLQKQVNLDLQSRGIELRPIDLTSTQAHLEQTLTGLDIVISAIVAWEIQAQIPLAKAAKTVGIKRFIPCSFAPVLPAGGLHLLRDEKEIVFNAVKHLYLPYTIIDVGWWYQLSVPILESGKTDGVQLTGKSEIAGDGSQLSALTDLHDIGKYVARIIVDDRTLNRYVLAYNELWSQSQIFDLFEKLSGETVPRPYVLEEELQKRLDAAPPSTGLDSLEAVFAKVPAQYLLSWGIRGDNTPEYAKYLGYLVTKNLYPDLQGRSFEEYAKEVLRGEAKPFYEELKKQFAAKK